MATSGSGTSRRGTVGLGELRRALAVLSPFDQDGILLCDVTGRVLEANDRVLDLYGVTRDRLLAEGLAAIVAPEPQAALSATIARALRSGHDAFTSAHVDADGRPFPIEIASHRLELDGQPFVLAFVRSLKARAEADRALRESEERYRRVVQNVPVVQFAIDRDGTFTLSEGQGLAALGLKPGEVVGRNVREVYAAVPEILRDFDLALAGESFRKVNSVGSITFETAWAPLRAESGAIVGVTGIAVDVTERMRAREERQRSEARLAVAERLAATGRLAAGVAHEVNNPLSYVVANLETAVARLESLGTDPEALAALRDAQTGAERVQAIVRDLRVFSRGGDEAGACDAAAVARSALTLAANELRHRAMVTTEFRPASPVAMPERRLAQVLVNLLVNAAQSIPEGHAQANEVRVSVRPRDAGVVVEVSDTGAGMTPQIQALIFEPFFSTKAIGEGMGLGLALCHAMVTDAGGTIEVESAPGKGSTFRLVLPAASAVVVAAEAPPVAHAEPVTRRLRVLAVDDEPLVTRALVRVLAGHDVAVANGGRAALERFAAGERFDVILCDLMMPDLTGMEVHTRLASEQPEQAARMIFLTGGAFTEAARGFLERTRAPTIEKPFSPEALRDAVARAAGAAR